MPKVSIIVPVYNVEDYLERCLRSLERQTLEDVEILLVDDGSERRQAARSRPLRRRPRQRA